MTVDELINELQDIKELHPLAGRCDVVNNFKQPLIQVNKNKTHNFALSSEMVILKFEP